MAKHSKQGLLRWAEYLYRLALWTLPGRTRNVFRQSMLQDFRALARECQGRTVLLAWMTLREAADVVAGGLRERVQRPLALRRLGNMSVLPRTGGLLADLRFALRALARIPGFSFTVLLTIGVGIGMTAAVFSVVDHVLLRPLPYPEAERLVRVWGGDRRSGEQRLELSYQDFEALQERGRSFQTLAAFSTAPRRLSGPHAPPTTITIARVSPGFFPLLQTPFRLGRTFSEAEFTNQEAVAVLSWRLWQGRFGGDEGVLGRTVEVQGEAHRIIGLLPKDWEYPDEADLFRPLGRFEMEDDDREFFVLGRLKPSASVQQAEAESAAIVERRADADPRSRGRYTAWVQPFHGMLVSDVRMPLLLLMAAVATVLLIICLNVSNLLLARGMARRAEMALRAALGASQGRLSRIILWEALVLSLAGLILGLGLGYVLLEALIAAAPPGTPRLSGVTLDARIAVLLAATSLACAILAGLLPAWLDSRPDLRSLMGGGWTRLSARGGVRLRRGLIVAELALATVLVVVAGLLASSFQHLISFERGVSNLSALEIPVGPSERISHSPSETVRDLFGGIRARLSALPGVKAVAFTSSSPLRPGGLRLGIGIEGIEIPAERSSAQMRFVSHDFFEVAGIPVLEGRTFDPDLDHATADPSAIVNRAFVKAYSLEGSALGRRIVLTSLAQDGQAPSLTVVGVAADLRPSVDSNPRPAIYLPFQQRPWAYTRLLVLVSGHPREAVPMLRENIWAIAPDVTLDGIRTLREALSEDLAGSRFSALLVGSFAFLSLALAALGLYGVVSYSVQRQTRSLAVRRALGAKETGLAWMVVREGLLLVVAGGALGLPAAWLLARLLTSQLYQVTAADPPTYAGTLLCLAAAALLSSILPARRALRLDPAAVLRDE